MFNLALDIAHRRRVDFDTTHIIANDILQRILASFRTGCFPRFGISASHPKLQITWCESCHHLGENFPTPGPCISEKMLPLFES